jgi:hypothetical protein
MLIKWEIQDFYSKVLMAKLIKYQEQKAFYFNAKIVDIVETLKNQIK